MPFTPEQISLRAIPLDDKSNLARAHGNRVVWRWECPGEHLYERETIATEGEMWLSERAICADPYCHYCRKARGE